MRKKLISIALVSVCLFVFAGIASAQVYRLSFSTHDPVTSRQSQEKQAWIDRVQERSGGRLEITLFAGGALAGPTAVLDTIKTGAADIGWMFTSFFPGQFFLTDVVALPMLGITTTSHGVNVWWDMYAHSQALRDELYGHGLQVLMMYVNPTQIITTSQKPIYTLADLQGMRIRAAAGVGTDMVAAWGGVPIMMGPGDIYQSIERGTIDGAVFEFTGIQSFRLPEVTNHYTELRFYVGPFIIAMNQGSFNALPEDLRQIIMEESGKAASIVFAQAFEEVKWQSRERIIAGGGNVIVPTAEALAEFRVEADAYINQWVIDRTTGAFNAQDFLDKTKEAIVRHAGQ